MSAKSEIHELTMYVNICERHFLSFLNLKKFSNIFRVQNKKNSALLTIDIKGVFKSFTNPIFLIQSIYKKFIFKTISPL